MDGLNEMWLKWVRCTRSYMWDGAGARKEDRGEKSSNSSKDQEVRGENVSVLKSYYYVDYEPDRRNYLGGTIVLFFFSMTWWKVWSSAAQTNHATNHQMIIFQDRGKRVFVNWIKQQPGLSLASLNGQLPDRDGRAKDRAAVKTNTTAHWGGVRGTPLASLPAGPSAPRRCWWRPLSVEMHNVHTWERHSYTVRRSS